MTGGNWPLVERIDAQQQSVGIVVGVIDSNGQRVVSYGNMGKQDPRPVDGDTVYEIGSITKVFTALLLSDMARKGELKLDDPVAKYLSDRSEQEFFFKVVDAQVTFRSERSAIPMDARDLPDFHHAPQ